LALALVDIIETVGNGNDHRGHRQRIKKGRQKGAEKAEEERDPYLRLHSDQDAGKDELQEILHEIDAGDHEDEQQDDLEIGQGLLVHRFRFCQTEDHRLDCQQAAGGQWIAFEGHGQGEDKLADEQPAGEKGSGNQQHQRVEYQKGNNGQLVPVRCIAEKVAEKGVGLAVRHQDSFFDKVGDAPASISRSKKETANQSICFR
jgi:hypothetical protein